MPCRSESSTTCCTPVARAAFITFCAPCTLVLMHSSGLYSAVSTCDGGCMDNHVHSFASPRQAFEVTDITDKETQLRILMTGIFLFRAQIASAHRGVNNDFLLRIITENGFHKLLSEGTCSSGNHYGFIVKHYNEKFYSSIYSHG